MAALDISKDRTPTALRKHTKRRVQLLFKDEARIGQKGRKCHLWWTRGERPRGIADKRFTSAYMFAAVEPSAGVASKTRLRHGASRCSHRM